MSMDLLMNFCEAGYCDRRKMLTRPCYKKEKKICIGAARGLHYLHAGAKRTIIHPHIKPSNILLDDNMEPKLAGFDLSIQGAHFMSKPKLIQVPAAGTYGYLAMEVWTDNTVTGKTDVYSFGMVLLEVVCGRKYLMEPIETEFLEKPLEEKIDEIIKGSIGPECWQVFVDITLRCVKLEPDERPTMGEVEVELEFALSLQKQADRARYSLFSTTIIPPPFSLFRLPGT
uniref:Protein kinase domain-containing protein n=2 Tax=Glycine max TaxID=3847 RepID=K7MV11_SOYBN